MRERVAGYGLTVAIVSAAAVIAAGCSSSPPSTGTTSAVAGAARLTGSWAYPNGDLANTRDAVGSRISSANVSRLKEAWTFKLPAAAAKNVSDTGSLAAAPVVVNGVVYLQDLYANVYAISLATGKLKWEYQVGVAEKTGPGPDGVTVANGVVYGTTSTTAFALNAVTGAVVWDDKSLLNSGQGSFEIQPAVANGRVYLASAYGSGPGGGVIFALDAATGKELWSFSTVIGAEPGANTLGLGSGGVWETPLVGTDGSVTFGTGNPYQSIGEAISHPARDLYTDSEVNLSASTGKLRWYYQAVPDDFKDWDIQLSPISAAVGGVPAIIGGGKMGDVYAFNAATGGLLWKTPVGVHNGHDEDSRLLLEHKLKVTLPYTYEPGPLGGVLTDMAAAGGSVYVATIDLAFTFTSMKSVNGTAAATKPTGEIEALNLNTGKVEWDTKVPSLPLGATTVSNDLLFTTLLNGELIALNRSTGAIVYRQKLPATTNSPIAITSNGILVPAGGPGKSANDNAQLVAYSIPGRRTSNSP
ncbi:MAG: PQQ-binding-like beta-propeller repeat protein [Trebonia sp.]